MALIKSISGIRGTIGGEIGTNLTPHDIVECTAGFGTWIIKNNYPKKVVIGRDARMSGEIVSQLVSSTLLAMGIDVVDLGLSTTPTVEMAVPKESAGAGIIITASHNPKQWNALKFLNPKGEFISAEAGEDILQYIANGDIQYTQVDTLGKLSFNSSYIDYHIQEIFKLPLVKVEAIQAKKFKVVVDCINSTGAISIVPMLEQLGCNVIAINADMHGNFVHNPEPLPEHLTQIIEVINKEKADLGIVVDPDVDRLAFVCEDGDLFGEEYTLVAIADYILKHSKKNKNTVSNLSSTKSLKEITIKHGGNYEASAVGEVNVVELMKSTNAVIGGEGNGGIIYPELHYGRDAMVGVALFLSFMVETNEKVSILRDRYPYHIISKNKIDLEPGLDMDDLINKMSKKYDKYPQLTVDGLKILLDDDWVHLRKSNTEPIIRIYSESDTELKAEAIANKIKKDMYDIIAGKDNY